MIQDEIDSPGEQAKLIPPLDECVRYVGRRPPVYILLVRIRATKKFCESRSNKKKQPAQNIWHIRYLFLYKLIKLNLELVIGSVLRCSSDFRSCCCCCVFRSLWTWVVEEILTLILDCVLRTANGKSTFQILPGQCTRPSGS